jgi:hypothetical protein
MKPSTRKRIFKKWLPLWLFACFNPVNLFTVWLWLFTNDPITRFDVLAMFLSSCLLMMVIGWMTDSYEQDDETFD